MTPDAPPPEGGTPRRDEVHDAARQGFQSSADTYVRGRPDYPPAIAGWLADTLGVRAGTTVVDLGAGTGKFTARLVPTGAEVIAVEPVDAMRQTLARSLPGVTAVAGTAQAMPLAAGSADAVVCAQAFHWFATDAALAEIHRVLRPDGRLGLVWNVRDERVDWVAELTTIVRPYEGDAPRHYRGEWRRPFEHGGRLFGPLAVQPLDYVHRGPPETVIVDRFLSVSFIAALPAGERDRVAAKLRALCAGHPALAGRDVVEFPYRTEAWSCQRLDGV